jgi:hypothetical protein
MLNVLTVRCAVNVAECEVMASLTSANYRAQLFNAKITYFRVACYFMRQSNTAHSLIRTRLVYGRNDVHLGGRRDTVTDHIA